jgi:hypothetical protein
MEDIVPPFPVDSKKTFARIGRVADYCGICRAIRPLAVDETDEFARFLKIPLGFTRETTIKGTCEACGLVMPLDCESYAAISEFRDLDVYSLLRETFPEIASVRAEVLARAERLELAPHELSAEDRAKLIEDSLRAAALMVHDIHGRDSITDQRSRDGCLLTGFFLIVTVGVTMFVKDEAWSRRLCMFFLAVMLWTGCRALVYRIRRTPRALRKQIHPMLGRSLCALNPSLQEIEDALERMRQDNVVQTRRLRPDKVCEAVQLSRLDKP